MGESFNGAVANNAAVGMCDDYYVSALRCLRRYRLACSVQIIFEGRTRVPLCRWESDRNASQVVLFLQNGGDLVVARGFMPCTWDEQ